MDAVVEQIKSRIVEMREKAIKRFDDVSRDSLTERLFVQLRLELLSEVLFVIDEVVLKEKGISDGSRNAGEVGAVSKVSEQ
jgi:hypothetical protein